MIQNWLSLSAKFDPWQKKEYFIVLAAWTQ